MFKELYGLLVIAITPVLIVSCVNDKPLPSPVTEITSSPSPLEETPSPSIVGKWLRQRADPVTGSEVKTELTFAEGGVFTGKEDGMTVGNTKCFGSWEGKWHPDNDVVIVEGTSFYACTPSEVPPTRRAYYDAFKLRDSNTVFRTAYPDQEYVRQ